MKKMISRIFVLVMVAAVAFTVVHFAVLGNNSPTDTAFTFVIEDGSAILTGSTDDLSGAVMLPKTVGSGYPVVGIGENAFKDCADVTAFFLPDTVVSIGAYAFENCTSLAQAILPNGLTSIGEGAFWNCSGLVSVTLPATVTSIGSCAFYKCDGLESLVVLGAQTGIKGAFNVALDIGQTLAIRNPARYTLDPIGTTVYCFKNSAAYYDALQDDFSAYVLLDDCTLTAYTVRYVDEAGDPVADAFTLSPQPEGIRVAAVAPVVEDEELCYPDPGTQTIELNASSDNEMTFVYAGRTYTITFDANEGEPKDALVYGKADDTTLGDTTRYGYEFVCWKVIEPSADPHYNWGDADTMYLATDAVTDMYGDVTLQAVWKAIAVTVTFDAQGGTADAASMLAEFGETYGELTGAAREGYTFDGWYTSEGVKIESTTTVTAVNDHTLYAHWTINKYDVTVTTDGNGAASADLTTDVEYGALVTLTAEANPGYAFCAWETDDVTITDNAFTMPDKAVAIRATFTPIEYTITFDVDGGDEKEALTYVTTDNTVIGGATMTGYTFSYWTITATEGNWGAVGKLCAPTSTVNGKYGNVTLKAVWRANSLTVTYDGQGGTPRTPSKTVTVGKTYGTLTTATREGYTFMGWYSSPEGGSMIESTTTVTQLVDHSIYAYWTINKYNITLTTDGNGFVSADETNDVPYGTVVTVTAAPKPGYAFNEWISSDVEFDGDTITMPDKPITIKATFAPVQYTVTFDTDGGDAKDALAYNTTDETALGSAAKAGYSLTAWQVSVPAAAGDYNWGDTQMTYSAGQTVKGKYGDVTLKALWEGNAITVEYDAQGGASSSATKTVQVGGTYGTLAGAALEGYTFDGWYTAADGGTKITPDTTVTATADHTIFAHWTINKYSVTVTTDGNGTASADLTTDVAFGTLVTLTAEANEGYTFAAWEGNVTVTDDAFNMPNKAVTVKATFSANRYTIAFDANFETEQTMDPIDAVYDADADLPACTFERAGFAFLGWAAATDAETPEYADAEPVRNLTAEADATVTLYAVWQDIQVELIAKEGSTTVIDNENGFIYGLKERITKDELLDDYLDVVGNGRIEVFGALIGTGTVVQLYNENNGELVCEYQLIIFGDVTGDGNINSSDVTDLRNANAGLAPFTPGTALYFAADVTRDGNVNSSDITDVRSANAGLLTIFQG